jgi:hypothetical protein
MIFLWAHLLFLSICFRKHKPPSTASASLVCWYLRQESCNARASLQSCALALEAAVPPFHSITQQTGKRSRAWSFPSSRSIYDSMAIDAGIVLLRKRSLGLPSKDGSLNGIEQTQKHFLRKTRQGRVQKGESSIAKGLLLPAARLFFSDEQY